MGGHFYSYALLALIALCTLHSCQPYPIREDGCRCTSGWDEETSCYCSGRVVVEIPQNLWRNVTKLVMRRAGVSRIRSADFQAYAALTQIEILNAPNLAVIEADAFAPLDRLKKLSLKDCPKLDRIDGYLIDRKRELLTLEVKRTAISRIPKMKMVMDSLSPPAIDFSENVITSVETGEVDNILVSELRLSHNRIMYIADFAFKNSKIFVLRLDNNPLTEISPNAFAGIAALSKLDLSYTELQSLPEEGLGEVEMLNIQNTPSLKQLPPLVVFMNLKEAKLHYPYHCCLFKYAPASTRDVKLHAKKYEGNLQELREKYCATASPTSAPTPTTSTTERRSPSTTTKSTPTTVAVKRRIRNETKIRYKQGLTPEPRLEIEESFSSEYSNPPRAGKPKAGAVRVQSREFSELEGPSFSNSASVGNCTEGLSCNQTSDSIVTDHYGSGSGDRPGVRNRRNSHQSNRWEAVGQFGVFYDDEDYEDEDQEDEDAVWGRPVQEPSVETAKRQSDAGFVWGSWHEPEVEDSQKPALNGRRPAGSMLIPGHLDGIVWEPAAVSVPSVVVPCVDGDRAVNDYYANVKCTPQPDALNPCEDVMIGWHLRILIFFVWVAAIAGNVLVIVVLLITTQPRQQVNNFLMLNLAFADLCTGVYLAMLAITDVTTRGEYYNFAVAWQTGWGCKIAGTLSVFASELTIVTMMMISFEVWYNTKYAIFQKRLSLSVVFPVMLSGWIAASALAALPLLGVNDYSATSTCLPLRLERVPDRAYLITCLSLDVFGFGYIVFNYVSVYCAVARSTAATAHAQDVALAKLMFCLIFTDFLCWAPTVFFGLTAAAQAPLISISIAKVFLVLFYPLNAFANPWLYVFLTKRFRKNVSRFIRKHVWLHEFLLRHHHSTHPFLNANSSNNYFYQSQPHNATQTTNLTSRRSTPSTCSSAVVTPRGSKASLPRTDSTPRSSGSSGSCNEILVCSETSALLTPAVPVSMNGGVSGNGNGNGNAANGNATVVARRKSTASRFRPHMSDIIENSNSNSAEDDQKHSPPIIFQQNSKSPLQEPNGNMLYDYLPATLSTLIGCRRGSRRSTDDSARTSAGMELRCHDGLGGHDSREDSKIAEDQFLSSANHFPSLCFPSHAFQSMDSASDLSMESGYCTATPSLSNHPVKSVTA